MLEDERIAAIEKQTNLNEKVVEDFGSEWNRFDQSLLSENDHREMFEEYFRLFPWDVLTKDAVGADIGCGSGRWASLIAPYVKHLCLVDPSIRALDVARRNLAHAKNISFQEASVDSLPFERESLDFAYSLGVLHHVPDTQRAIHSISLALKPGAPFLIYLYYAFDHRPWWFRNIWRASDLIRRIVSKMPVRLKNLVCDVIALLVYLPVARMGRALDCLGVMPDSWPLSYYRNKEFYVIRTDALDRFGTRLEHRFTRQKIEDMLRVGGFECIRFSDRQPFWCAVGIKVLSRRG